MPVKTDMDTVVLGTNPVGLPIYFDRNAYQADGIVLANRVKPHTDFRGVARVGRAQDAGDRAGQARGGQPGPQARASAGSARSCRPSAGSSSRTRRFALGLAILENAEDVTAEIVALEPETIFDVEPKLLERARGLMGRLPFDQIDVLIVGELGKNYSGAGMDPNVIGRLYSRDPARLRPSHGHAPRASSTSPTRATATSSAWASPT